MSKPEEKHAEQKQEQHQQQQKQEAKAKAEAPEFHIIGNPPKEREVKPEPWDNQAFYDKVRAAGFPTSSYGDAAFMAACYNLASAVQPSPPEPPAKK